jgi:hypothetical protein
MTRSFVVGEFSGSRSGGFGDWRPGDELNGDLGCVGPDPTKKYRQAIAESNSRAQSERLGFDPATQAN